ncbi:hypothetical protein J437_LFUL008299 [Ladona fulva]|uniref:Uncharacterized protein n=1 Tax=Ladona fulva TaxID=123851 RepID=A0A8K0P102_LADFU|nr:hypothetical protein J437_LFUL008299 [Ladona fulva]
MKTEKFGSQFYVGKIIRHYEELPLHYLIGVWGSAFSILFKRLAEDNKEMKLMHGQANYDSENEDGAIRKGSDFRENLLSSSGNTSPTPSDDEIENDEMFVDAIGKQSPTPSEKEYDDVFVDNPMMPKSNLRTTRRRHTMVKFSIDDDEEEDNETHKNQTSSDEVSHVSFKDNDQAKTTDSPDEAQTDDIDKTKNKIEFKAPEIIEAEENNADKKKIKIIGLQNLDYPSSEESDTSVVSYELTDHLRRKTYIEDVKFSKMSLVTEKSSRLNNFVQQGLAYLGQSRRGRAGAIFNPLRGLSLSHTYPINPTFEDSDEDEDFQGAEEPIEAYAATLCLVDAGLAFNSPFPLLLRPQRAVDVFLSFDYSSRPADFHEAFGELILAEKWAIRNNVNFPPIQEIVEKYYNEPMREVYVFQHPYDPYCPIVVHCIIFNGLFKEYKAPNVKRETSDEFKFADFKVFSDRSNPYSSFRYTYTPFEFDRLSKLMEFNTLYGMKTFHAVLKKAVKRKRKLLSRPAPVIRLSQK